MAWVRLFMRIFCSLLFLLFLRQGQGSRWKLCSGEGAQGLRILGYLDRQFLCLHERIVDRGEIRGVFFFGDFSADFPSTPLIFNINTLPTQAPERGAGKLR